MNTPPAISASVIPNINPQTPAPVTSSATVPAQSQSPSGTSSTPKWSTQSFAAAIRSKSPTGVANDGTPYANLSDEELTSRMVAKYPVYGKQIADFQPKFDAKVQEGNPITDHASNLMNEFSDKSDSQKIAADIQRSGENFTTASNPITKAGALLQGLFQVGGHVISGAGSKIMVPLTALGETAGQDSKTIQSAASSAPVNATADAVHPAVQGMADWAAKHPDAAADLNATIQAAGLAIGAPEVEAGLDTVKGGVDAAVDTTKAAAETVTDAAKTAGGKLVDAGAGLKAQDLADAAKVKATQTAADTKKGINMISPKLTTGEMRRALAKGTVTNEVPGKANIFKNITADFFKDPHMQNIYESVKDFLNPKAKTATENLHNVQNGISAVSEHEVKPHLEEHPVPFNFEDLRGYLDNVHPSSAIKADKGALENFNRTKEDILSLAEHHLRASQTTGGEDVTSLTDVNDLWNPGKAIDSHIQNQLGESTFDTPQYTGIKAAATAMRNAFRGFMSDSLRYPGQMELYNRFKGALNDMPKNMREKMGPVEEEDMASQMGLRSTPDNAAHAAYLDRKMSEIARMFEARDNLAAHAQGEQGTSAYRRFMNEHPIIKAGTRTGVRTAAITAGVHPFIP